MQQCKCHLCFCPEIGNQLNSVHGVPRNLTYCQIILYSHNVTFVLQTASLNWVFVLTVVCFLTCQRSNCLLVFSVLSTCFAVTTLMHRVSTTSFFLHLEFFPLLSRFCLVFYISWLRFSRPSLQVPCVSICRAKLRLCSLSILCVKVLYNINETIAPIWKHYISVIFPKRNISNKVNILLHAKSLKLIM